MPADLHKVRPHEALNRNLDHNWQQALLKTSSERRIAVDIALSGWQEQLVLTMTCEDGVSVTHTLDGEFAEATRRKKRWPIYVMAWRSSARPFITRVMCRLICRRCLFRTVCLTNCAVKPQRCSIRRASMRQRGTRKPVSVPPPVYPETHLSFRRTFITTKRALSTSAMAFS